MGANQEKYAIDLKLARFPNTGDPDLDRELMILYQGIRNLAGDYYDTSSASFPAVPFQAGGPGAVGNGTLKWSLRVRNGMCRFDFALTIGATTNLGGGVAPITFSYPIGFQPLLLNASTGTAIIVCAAAAAPLETGIVFAPNPAGLGFGIHIPQIPGVITPVVPAAFAAGDFIGFCIDYPYVA